MRFLPSLAHERPSDALAGCLFVFTPHRMIVDSQVVKKVLINEIISHFVASELTLLMRQDDQLQKTRKRLAFDKLSVVLIPPGDIMHALVTFY